MTVVHGTARNSVRTLIRKRPILRKNMPIPDSAINIFQWLGVEAAGCIACGVSSMVVHVNSQK